MEVDRRNDNPENLSITHLEFRHAGARNMPRIVLQRSAIPNVERSDIFDASEMESIRVFHTEVSNTVRPAQFSDVTSLIEMLRVGMSNELRKLALCEHPALLRDQRAEYLAEHLEALVPFEPKRVARLANALLDQTGEAMANMATSWYLSSEPLLAVALALQDMGEPSRTDGIALFERMLEFNIPNAHEVTLDLDKRTPNAAAVRPPRRRRRSKQ